MLRKTIMTLSALGMIVLAGDLSTASARLIGKRDAAKTEATPVSLRSAQPELLPPGGPVVAAGHPCITYRNRGCLDVCCGGEAPIETVLLVKDPVTCCCVEVPICLPPCCVDEPEVCGREGLFGRGIVDYEWCCGFAVKVIFRARGDIVVTYVGR